MKKAKITPEMMDVIINCQNMKEKIYPNYDRYNDFKNLSLLTIDQLRRLQDMLIPMYNFQLIKRITMKTVTKEIALTANEFYHTTLKNKDRKQTVLKVRRTGKTQTWKTRPNEFKVPVKYGLYESTYITHLNANEWYILD